MDATERARLRALCEMAPPIPWDAVMDEENGVLLVETVPRGDVPVACVEVVKHRGVQLMIDSVNALPALLDALDAAEARHADRDAAERVHLSAYNGSVARRERAEAERDALRALLDGILDAPDPQAQHDAIEHAREVLRSPPATTEGA